VLTNFASEISTDIGGLGVDTTTDTAEEGNGGATETVTRDELEKLANLVLDHSLVVFTVKSHDGGTVSEDDDLKDAESKSDEAETEDLSAVEGSLEALVDVNIAKVGDLNVGLGSNLHTDETGEHGGSSSDNEGKGGVGEGEVSLLPWLVNGAEEDNGEDEAENAQVGVFLAEEGLGAL